MGMQDERDGCVFRFGLIITGFKTPSGASKDKFCHDAQFWLFDRDGRDFGAVLRLGRPRNISRPQKAKNLCNGAVEGGSGDAYGCHPRESGDPVTIERTTQQGPRSALRLSGMTGDYAWTMVF